MTQYFGDRWRDQRRRAIGDFQRFINMFLLLLLLFFAASSTAIPFQLLIENHVFQFDPLGVFPRRLVDVIDGIRAEQPGRLKTELDGFPAPAEDVGMQRLGDVVHLDVHEHDLRQIKVDVGIGQGEHLVGKISVHTRLFGPEGRLGKVLVKI